MATQGKCDVCGKFKELEPPRKKFLNVPDDYLMLCLECRAKVGKRRYYLPCRLIPNAVYKDISISEILAAIQNDFTWERFGDPCID